MRKPFFDNIRWVEITTGLMGLSGFLTALVQSPIPEKIKPWVMVAVSVVGFLLAFLRNPKSLDWVDEAYQVADSVRQAQTTASGVTLPLGIDATGPADDVDAEVVQEALQALLLPSVGAAAPAIAQNVTKELARVVKRGIKWGGHWKL